MQEIILATGNPHKVAEILSIFEKEALKILLIPQSELASPPAVIEDADTFSANALKKARALCSYSQKPAIADDSGLVVDALEGQPGVLSARWAGAHVDDQANLDLVLEQMKDVADELRQAKFVCAAAFVMPNGTEFVVEGELTGRLTKSAIGSNGFGYDPIFIPAGYDITTAQMDPAQKNAISHRGIAFKKLAVLLRSLISD
jgi:XTP/dITP diphosphohydrolase